jgi:hypothetical protein
MGGDGMEGDGMGGDGMEDGIGWEEMDGGMG